MPLTEQQIEETNTLLVQIEEQTRDILTSRDDLYASLRIHRNIPDESCGAVLQYAKARIKAAAEGLADQMTEES